jgi:hypothetical protein
MTAFLQQLTGVLRDLPARLLQAPEAAVPDKARARKAAANQR